MGGEYASSQQARQIWSQHDAMRRLCRSQVQRQGLHASQEFNLLDRFSVIKNIKYFTRNFVYYTENTVKYLWWGLLILIISVILIKPVIKQWKHPFSLFNWYQVYKASKVTLLWTIKSAFDHIFGFCNHVANFLNFFFD